MGDFTPYLEGNGSNIQKTANSLCGTGKLNPATEKQICNVTSATPSAAPVPLNAPPAPSAPTIPAPSATATDGAPSAGVLGVSGANWTEGGLSGVEILDVAPDSAAATAGLRSRYVITEINGRHVRSTEDLAAILAQNGPGSRIAVAYIVKTGLGWMPSETSAVLTNR